MLILLKGEYMKSGLPKWDFPRIHLKCGIFTEDVDSVPKVGGSSGGGNANPHQYSCLESPMDRGAWWATVHGVCCRKEDPCLGPKSELLSNTQK